MQEKKVYEAGGHAGVVITTHRLVIGGQVFDLGDVNRATSYIDRPWGCALILGGSALVALLSIFSGNLAGLLGAPLFAGAAYLSWKKMTDSELWLFTSGDTTRIKVRSLETLALLEREVNKALTIRASDRAAELGSELDNLPPA